MHRAHRFIFTVDHMTDEQLSFFGWVAVEEWPDFKLYRRMHDGEEQMVSNETPRRFVVDDVNDAQQMSAGGFMTGPDPLDNDH
jgi:hypothetical protein